MELLNSLDSVAAERTIPAYFLLMVRTTTRKAGKPRFSLNKFAIQVENRSNNVKKKRGYPIFYVKNGSGKPILHVNSFCLRAKVIYTVF